MTVNYDNTNNALENLSEGTILYYQLPEQIEIVDAQQGDLKEDSKVVGSFTISQNGLVKITFNDGYFWKSRCEGQF